MGVIWIVTAPFVGAFADKVRPSRAFTLLRLLRRVLLPYFDLFREEVMVFGGAIVRFNMALYNFTATTLMPRAVRTTGIAVGMRSEYLCLAGRHPICWSGCSMRRWPGCFPSMAP